MRSEIRKDYLLNKYVIITPGRAKRPRDIHEETILHRDKTCVLCPEDIERKLIVDSIGPTSAKATAGKPRQKWKVLTLNNKYPAVTLKNKKAFGWQEVIIETPKHGIELGELSETEICDVLQMYKKRTKEISLMKKMDYILVFKNNGSKAGASILHAHSQIFATNMLPPDVHEELDAAKKYRFDNKTCPYCDIIKKESKSKRKIFVNSKISVFAPYASAYHYEAWLFPQRHVDNITKLTSKELSSFAKALKKLLIKLHSIDVSYNFFMHQVISDKDQHFYIKLQPRDSIWAGIELGSGLVINSISPEVAAKFYRK